MRAYILVALLFLVDSLLIYYLDKNFLALIFSIVLLTVILVLIKIIFVKFADHLSFPS
jgi:uncharacterized protein (DUF58 family)